MYNEKKEFFKTRDANRKVSIFLKWVSGYVFILKFLESVDYEKAYCFRLERPVNTPNEDSLQLSRQVREWEHICTGFIYHGLEPLGQELCVSALLIEGIRVTRYAWKHERQWPCLYLLHIYVPVSHGLAYSVPSFHLPTLMNCILLYSIIIESGKENLFLWS